MAKKVAELELSAFITEVQNYDSDLYTECMAKGIDVQKILAAQKPACDALSVRAGVSIARGRLQKELSNLTAEYLTGVIVGSNDRYNKKSPIKIAMLSPAGNHFELSTFDARAKMGGTKVDVVYPSIAKIMVKFDQKWENYNVQEFASMEPVGRAELIDALETLAKTPGELGIQHEKHVVVVKGVISGVVPTPILAYDEIEEKYYKAGEFEVLEDQTGPKEGKSFPCMGFRLLAEKNQNDTLNYVTATIGKQRFGHPVVDIGDLLPACEQAVQAMPEDPREQTSMVGDSVKGLIVYIVGYMGQIGSDRNDNYEDVNYIRINVDCIIESGMFVGADGQIMSVDDFEGGDESTPAPEETSVAPDVEPAPAKKAPAKTAPAKTAPAKKPAADPEPEASEPEVNPAKEDDKTITISIPKIKSQITGFCRISGTTPEELNLEELHPVIMDGKVPKAMIQSILEDMIEEEKNTSA